MIGIEDNVFQKSIVQQYQVSPHMPPVQGITSTTDKKTRIRASAVAYENGQVRFPKEYLHTDNTFYDEALTFPDEGDDIHDDTLDSAAITIKVAGNLAPHVDAMFKQREIEENEREISYRQQMFEKLTKQNIEQFNGQTGFDEHMGTEF
jgi:hypothetical protein